MIVDYVLSMPSGELRLTVSAVTDRGAVREHNEDSVLAEPPVFLVADGMGGHSFGDRASRIVVDTFAATVGDGRPQSPDRIIDTIHRANDAVLELGDDEETMCGTTLSGVALVRSQDLAHWMVFNVGDSRVYTWDGRELAQVTVDHSAVQELLELGEITAIEAAEHPYRNVVTRALGVGEAQPDVWLMPVSHRSVFIVCSDGLTKELDDDQIADIVAERFTAGRDGLAQRLVDAAIAAGGRDNVSVVIVDGELVGQPADADADTNDRGLGRTLEETAPRR